MSKKSLGKSSAMALHYGIESDTFDQIEWLTYQRSDDLVGDTISQFIRTALTYSIIDTSDLIVDAAGKMWRVDEQHIESPAGASTIRNLRITEVDHNAKVVSNVEGGLILTEDHCHLLTEDDCDLVREIEGMQVLAVRDTELIVGDIISAMPKDASSERSTSYLVNSILDEYAFKNHIAQRMGVDVV